MPISNGFAILTVLLTAAVLSSQTADPPNLYDDSDWWSILRELPNDNHAKAEAKDTDYANFSILGVNMRTGVLAAAQSKLGKVTLVDRGDAATGRAQICYRGERDNVHLIFEQGEVNSTFYLFSDGPAWTGSDLCATSPLVKLDLSTASGLRLGLSPAQVRSILGKPTVSMPNGDLIYFREIEKHTPAAELKQLRKQHAALSDQEFQQDYGSYWLSAYIVTKFSESKLVYLAVSESEVD